MTMKKRVLAALVAAAATAAVALAGCGSGVSDLSAEEAYDGVEERARDTAAAVFHNRLSAWSRGEEPCEFWGRSDNYRLLHRYEITNSSFFTNASLIEDARDHWREEGHRITRERTSGGHARDVAAVDSDGFSLRAWQNDHGVLYLHVASPCLAPEPFDVEEYLERHRQPSGW
jgi:hypothetical protein